MINYQSTIELALLDLVEKGKVNQLDDEASQKTLQTIDSQMEKYEMEKQKRAAKSADDLAKVVLTA